MSLVKRQIDVTIQLGSGSFDGTNADKVTLTGHRVSAHISSPGGEAFGFGECQIFGLPLSMINQLTRIGPFNTANGSNTILIEAGNQGEVLTTVFKGVIYQAWGDFQAAPEVSLNISAYGDIAVALTPVNSNSFNGSSDVADIMQTLATAMGLAFENNGVSVQLSGQYLPGTALSQVQTVARAAKINYAIERGKLKIWPMNGYAAGEVPLISPATGMVGYPAFSSQGLFVTSEFVANALIGAKVTVQSSLTPACGDFQIGSIIHDIESERPGGAWFTHFNLFPLPAVVS